MGKGPKNKTCSSCTVLKDDKKECVKRSCIFFRKTGCASCKAFSKKGSCLQNGCMWQKDKCASCTSVGNKQKCKDQNNCAISGMGKGRTCRACVAVKIEKDCKKGGCIWLTTKGSCTICPKITKKKACNGKTEGKCEWIETGNKPGCRIVKAE